MWDIPFLSLNQTNTLTYIMFISSTCLEPKSQLTINLALTHFKITNSHSKMILEGIHSQLSHSTRHYYILINLRRSNNVSACKNVVERLRWQFCNFLFCTTMFHCYTVLVNWARGIFANMNHSSKTMYM